MKRLTLLVVALLFAPALSADEGMWLPRQIPELAPELAAAGMELDPGRLADLLGDPLGAVVSLGGCTASFVSPDGLIVTNHHCVARALQYNSTAVRDLVEDGFLAATRERGATGGAGLLRLRHDKLPRRHRRGSRGALRGGRGRRVGPPRRATQPRARRCLRGARRRALSRGGLL